MAVEFVNWASRLDIKLDNSGVWHPAGNMHAETNIKKVKQAISWLCGHYKWTTMSEGVQLRIMAINDTPVGRSKYTPTELLHALYLGHTGLPRNLSDINRMSEERQDFLDRMYAIRRSGYRDKKIDPADDK